MAAAAADINVEYIQHHFVWKKENELVKLAGTLSIDGESGQMKSQ